MKRKEICEKTGLTPKALRLYEEKGLITPAKSGLHNQMREYSREDLERLQVIATLRRAMFTLTEIREMLEDPASIQRIFPQYLSWLRQQSDQIRRLLAVSEQVDLSRVDGAEDLTRQIEGAASELPIPASDIRFRFRQLDEMEEKRPDTMQGGNSMKFNDITGGNDLIPEDQKDRMYRQFVADSSKDYTDNLAVAMGQWHEAMDLSPRAKKRRERRKKVLDIPVTVWAGIGGLILLFVGLLAYGLTNADQGKNASLGGFSALAPRGTVEAFAVELGDASKYGDYTVEQIDEASRLILDSFTERFRDCTLRSLSFTRQSDQHVWFSGEIRSGEYLSRNLGVEEKNQNYTVRWKLYFDNGRWVIVDCRCD